MEFWLFAPFRVPLNIQSERFAANPAAFAALLPELKKRLPEALRPFLQLPEVKTGADTGPRFESMKKHGSDLRSLQVLQLAPSKRGDLIDHCLAEATHGADAVLPEAFRGLMAPVETGWQIVLCDNSVAELWLQVAVSDPEPGLLEYFDRWSTRLAETAVRSILKTLLYPLLDALHELPNRERGELVRPRLDFEAIFDLRGALDKTTGRFSADYSPLLWVGRVCLLPQQLQGWHEPLSEWATALDWGEPITDASAAKTYLAWGNSVVIVGTNALPPDGLRDAFLRAQYYFAALDVLNRNLMQLYAHLGDSGERPKQRRLQQLNARVGRSAVALDLLAMEYNDTRQEVQGRERMYLEKLLAVWGIDDLLEATQRKLMLARERLQRINRMRSLISQRRVELLLIFVGSVALLDLGIKLAEKAGPLEDGQMLGWLNRVSQDSVLTVSILLVVIICVVAGGWLKRH